jgi:hypothetical protein
MIMTVRGVSAKYPVCKRRMTPTRSDWRRQQGDEKSLHSSKKKKKNERRQQQPLPAKMPVTHH